MQKAEISRKRKDQSQPHDKRSKRTKESDENVNSTGIMYNKKMLDHCGDTERPQRLIQIMSKLEDENILERCKIMEGRECTDKEIRLVHTQSVLNAFKKGENISSSLDLGNDVCINKFSKTSLQYAVGGLIELSYAVMDGSIKNGFSINRPPGHHAGRDKSQGFCLVNNVAICAKAIQKKYKKTKVMIIDWDIHHGNGTEEIFIKDDSVQVFSVHKKGIDTAQQQIFFPGTGDISECGDNDYERYNVNATFRYNNMSDGDYISLFKLVVVPMIKEFSPGIILVAAGFDCAEGDSMNINKVTPAGFANMLSIISNAANEYCGGKLVVELEGGYKESVLAEGDSPQTTNEMPCEEGWNDIQHLINFQKSLKADGHEYWHFFDDIENTEDYLKISSSPLVSALTKEEKQKDDSLFLFFQWLMAKSTRQFFNVARSSEDAFELWKAFTNGIQTNFDLQLAFVKFLKNKCDASKTFRLKYVNTKDKNSDFILRKSITNQEITSADIYGDFCLLCARGDSSATNDIVFCSTCEDAYHQDCDHIEQLPGENEDWFCKMCIHTKEVDERRKNEQQADKPQKSKKATKGKKLIKEKIEVLNNKIEDNDNIIVSIQTQDQEKEKIEIEEDILVD